MPRVGVVRLSIKVPPRVGTICAFLSWFESVAGLNHRPEWPRGKLFVCGNAGGPASTLTTLRQLCPLILRVGRWRPFGSPRSCLVDRLGLSGGAYYRSVGSTTSAPYTMKNGVKPFDLLGVIRKLQSTEGISATHFPHPPR
jgi:hypothetical protein